MATNLTAGVPYKTNQKKTSSKLLIQVSMGPETTLYLFGSLNGTDYVQLETFTADDIKEVSSCPYISFSKTAGDHDDTTSVGAGAGMLVAELSGY